MIECPHCSKPLSKEFILSASGSLLGQLPSKKRVDAARKNGLLGGRKKGEARPSNPSCDYQKDCSWTKEVRVLQILKEPKVKICHRHYVKERNLFKSRKFINRPSFPLWKDLPVFEAKSKIPSLKK